MTHPRLHILLVAAALALAGLVASPAQAASSAAATGCRLSDKGPSENRWLGGAGTWSDSTQWSLGVVPGTTTRDHACLPPGSDVVVDVGVARVDLDLLEVAGGARLTLRPGTALFVWGDQQTLRSVVRRDAVLEVDGATFGGGGRLRVMGKLSAHSISGGSQAVLTSRPVSSPTKGRRGLLELADQGVLDVSGPADVRLARTYVVSVRGRARLHGRAGLVADNGTAFMLQPRAYGSGVGQLTIDNNRGFAKGRSAGIHRLATFVNDGLVVKRNGQGTSRIDGYYRGGGRVVERSGSVRYLVLPLTDGCVEGPVACGDDPTTQVPQTASLQVPVTDPNGAKVVIAPLEDESVPGALGVPMKVHATGLQATFADPAVIELHYDATLFTPGSPPPDPTRLVVGHADGAGSSYADVPSCAGPEIPLGAFACLDVAASHREGSDLVVVIRTVDTSRWIVR